MRIVVLIDNISDGSLESEWGLSFYIESNGKKVLLDTGYSPLFIRNAQALGIDLATIDLAVLSHAHDDHAGGMKAFYSVNSEAPFYLSKEAKEDTYTLKHVIPIYDGIPKGTLQLYGDRIKRSTGLDEIADGIYLLSHTTPNLEKIGKRNKMVRREGLRFRYDDYAHEQSLIFREEQGLIIFNSCSHAGADAIIEEVKKAFPGEKIYAILGGFHLYQFADDEVRAFAHRVKDTGIQEVYTGHCSGQKGCDLMKEELGDMVHQFRSGLEIVL